MKKLISLFVALAMVLSVVIASAESEAISPLSFVYISCALQLEDGSYLNDLADEQKFDFQFYTDGNYVAINMGTGDKYTGTWSLTDDNYGLEITYDDGGSVIATMNEDDELVVPAGDISLILRDFMRGIAGSFVTTAWVIDGEVISTLPEEQYMTFVMYDNHDFDVKFNGRTQSGTWANTDDGLMITDERGISAELVPYEDGGFILDTGVGSYVLLDFIAPDAE